MLKHGIILVLLVTILAICLTSIACKQSATSSGNGTAVQEWVSRYDNRIADDDGAWAITVDSSENIYVTGYSWSKNNSSDYATINYDSKGKQRWIARYNGSANSEDWAWDVALDSLGNIYVTGWSTGDGTQADFATVKYDSAGKQIWAARYNGPANGYDMAYALALDKWDNIYVTGWSQGINSEADYATIKYNSEGAQIWVARYNGPASGEDKAAALAVDGSGNVYVTGSSMGNETGADYVTVKYDTEGNMAWVARYNGTADSDDRASAIAPDSAGNVYVTGSSTGSGTDTDYATVKYDSKGKQLWVARYSGPAGKADEASAIAWDGTGGIYVTGSSTGNNTNADYATIKYDSSGSQLWVARYNGPVNRDDNARAMALDNSGNVYVTGWSVGTGMRYDYATVKYYASGNELWAIRFDGPVNLHDKAYDLALGNSGSIYVTGRSSGKGSYYDYATVKYIQ